LKFLVENGKFDRMLRIWRVVGWNLF